MTERVGPREGGKQQKTRALTAELLDLVRHRIADGISAVDAWTAISDAESEVYQWGCEEAERKRRGP